jgi:lipopolysaccharide export LptBFGC system permease protein LptF
LGELCRECRQEIARRAGRIARWVALGSTVLLAVYVGLRMPRDPTSRSVGAMAVVAWYLMVNLIVRRILTQHLR